MLAEETLCLKIFCRDHTNTQLANDCHILRTLVDCELVKIFFLNYELGNLNKPLKVI